MEVIIDLKYAPENLRILIQKSTDFINALNQNEYSIIIPNESDIQAIKSNLEQLLKENNMRDFVVVENTEKENEIAILKKGDIEQLGIFLCTHCGISFESEIQRTVHQRIHYLG